MNRKLLQAAIVVFLLAFLAAGSAAPADEGGAASPLRA